jgi:hypothetical protein
MPMLFWLPAVILSEMWSMAWARDADANQQGRSPGSAGVAVKV